MGGCLSCSRDDGFLTTAKSVDIPLPSEAVWEVIADIDNIASIVRLVQSFERIGDDKGEFRVGTKWKEVRCMTLQDFRHQTSNRRLNN